MIYSADAESRMTEHVTKINATWKGEMAFLGQNDAGGTVQIGTLGGQPGVGPMQLLLFGLAGCTGVDIISILQKKRVALKAMEIEIQAKRAEDYPMIWTNIHVLYLLWGEQIQAKDVEQAIRLSEEKYCSVGIMLGKSAEISSEYRILKPGEKFINSK